MKNKGHQSEEPFFRQIKLESNGTRLT